MGSNVLEFRIVRRWVGDSVCDERVQFRTRNVIINVLGVSLSSWSAWQDLEAVPVVDEA
jgi:hypothetical protein